MAFSLDEMFLLLIKKKKKKRETHVNKVGKSQ